MSRIGKAPIPIPDKVTVTLSGYGVSGPKVPRVSSAASSRWRVVPARTMALSAFEAANAAVRSRERHGLCRNPGANMVEGVAKGFSRKLENHPGVATGPQFQGRKLMVSAGFTATRLRWFLQQEGIPSLPLRTLPR